MMWRPALHHRCFPLPVLLLGVVFATCVDPVAPAGVVGFEIEEDELRLAALEAQYRLSVRAHDANGDPADPPFIEWSSSDSAVATVGAPGWVTASGNGEAWITATALGQTDSVRVVVAQELAHVRLEPAAVALEEIGATASFTAEAVDANGFPLQGHAPPELRSLNPDVARLGDDGTITAYRDGQVTVEAEIDGARGYALVTVEVPGAAPVTEWTLEIESDAPLYGVWGAAQVDIFAVGADGLILHYDGAGWSTMASGTNARLESVWGTSPDHVYAAGTLTETSGTSHVVLHDGSSWSLVRSGQGAVSQVWGSAPDHVFAVGEAIHHYDGQRWTSREVRPTTSGQTELTITEVESIWAARPYDVWGVGRMRECHYTCFGGLAAFIRYDGGSWQIARSDLRATVMYGTAPDAIYAASGGLPSRAGAVYRFDGGDWVAVPNDMAIDLEAVWGPSRTDMYFGGGPSGWDPDPVHLLIRHYDGATWTTLHASPEPGQIQGLWGTATGDILAVGSSAERGRIYRGRRAR